MYDGRYCKELIFIARVKVNKRQFVIADGAYPREYDITFPERVGGRLEKRDLSTSEKVF